MMKIPEGWPTREMIDAGNNTDLIPRLAPMRPFTKELHDEILVKRFIAMLAAAPTPPAQEDLSEQVASLKGDIDLLASEMTYRGNSVQWWYAKAMTYSEAIDRCWAALKEKGVLADGKTDVSSAIRKLPPAQGEGEPVAWMVTRASGCDAPEFFVSLDKAIENSLLGLEVTSMQALFTHPADDELRKEAEEVTKYFDDGEDHLGEGQLGKFIRIIENLRKALEKGK